MKDGLLERIQSTGYWRVNIRPQIRLEDILTFARCQDLVQKARVSIRGWDFPHINHRQDESGGEVRGQDFYENWCDWWNQLEFWRMYRSGQFLAYNALWEDIVQDKTPSPKGTLEILDAIYSVTEFVEFARKLVDEGIYKSGAIINISLNNSSGRRLSVGPRRMSFFDERIADAQRIEVSGVIDSAILAEDHRTIAVDMLMDIFDYFGWNPARQQIESDQERFYRREFG